ncbi:MAG: Gfo/Idh/MocA family oxidoreductase [Planctomycetota bacterium]
MSSLRFGLSGCGQRGADVVAAVRSHSHCELVALHDPDPAQLTRLGEAAGIRSRYVDFDAMLHSGIDFVVLANPCGDRLAQVLAAAAQGVHCLVHAPMAPDARTADAMVSACDRAGVKLGVANMSQGDSRLEQVRRMIADDWLGTVVSIHAMTACDRVLKSPPEASHWLRDPARAGRGTLLQLAAESLHVAVWLTERAPLAAAALSSTGFTALSEDAAVAAVRLRGGALCTFASSRLCIGRSLSIHGTDGSACLTPDEVTLVGRKAFAGDSFDYQEPGVPLRLSTTSSNDPLLDHFELHGRFARWIDDRDDFPCPGDQAALDMRALDAMQRSIETGRTETILP